ncbi:hypothetical protein K461DRAFT_275448 [Myriangium duriaei CBS 260.36]|uniref:Uncharacterized protein n=1 Tax=Myriangium duriaei CBS 260.36 TaxID=1168546 RepID=A0A9P4MNL0_9PEZI|nr:hypothetical protein K461DRAFT_275448 [Myriangium duriaei CBS 260.36]
MAVQLDHAALRIDRPREIARHLKDRFKATTTDHLSSITAQIDASVAGGLIPPRVFVIWIGITRRKDPDALVAGLRQSHNLAVRSGAISFLTKALRQADTFGPTWNAVGGAGGLADLMVEFSVNDVKAICSSLGKTGSAVGARVERQQRISELLELLCGQSTAGRDPRPLKKFYKDLVLASTDDVVQNWERKEKVKWSAGQRALLFRAHSRRYEQKFLDEIFSVDHKDVSFEDGKHLFKPNPSFAELILARLTDIEGGKKVRIPHDISTSFIRPLLKRLSRRRFQNEYRVEVFKKIVQCFEKHRALSDGHLHASQGGIFRYALQYWNEVPDGQKGDWYESLESLAPLLPKTDLKTLSAVEDLVKMVKVPLRYSLLRLLLKQTKNYKLDIDSFSEADARGLRQIPQSRAWPVTLFIETLDNENSLALFRRLSKVHVSGQFIINAQPHGRGPAQVWTQPCYQSTWVDSEIVRSVLIRKSKDSNESKADWLEQVVALIEERKRKAVQSREGTDRAFWAKSALLLCLAAGALERYQETMIWARRFNKDSLTVKEIYSKHSIRTEDGTALLCALPVKEESSEGPAADRDPIDCLVVSKSIECTNTILLDLLETATMVAREPSFQRYDWNEAFGLPAAVVGERFDRIDGFKSMTGLSDTEISDLVYKPTVDMLLEAEALLLQRQGERDKTAKTALPDLNCSAVRAVLWNAGKLNPTVLADLVTYLLESMKRKLEPARLEQQIGGIMSIVQLLAHSDQPSLACPFVREMVLSGDNSSWHRQLVNAGFLSLLPSKTARSFLNTMADAIKEKLQEQNARRDELDRLEAMQETPSTATPTSTAQRPAVKVTTVKMLAQILQDALFIDHASSCDILVDLLPHAKHIDIQLAIIDSLLSILAEPTSTLEMRTQILDALELHVVPVAGRLNERRPTTKAAWAAATKHGNPLPEINHDDSILNLLHNRANGLKFHKQDKDRLAHIIVRALEESVRDHTRWISLFLEKNGLVVGSDGRKPDLPIGPSNLSLFVTLAFKWTPYMTRTTFDMLERLVIANLEPSPAIEKVNKTVRETPELLNSDAGKHWLSQYGNGSSALTHGVYQCLGTLANKQRLWETKVDNGVTLENLQDFVIEAANVLFRRGELKLFDGLVTQHIGASWTAGGSHLQQWKSNTVPIIQCILQDIESYRTQKWQRDQNRTPTVLPDTFLLHIRMLPLPYSSVDEPAQNGDNAVFVAELSKLIDFLAARRSPYHKDWKLLKENLVDKPRQADFTYFGLSLGSLKDVDLANPSLADFLRVDLAGEFLKKTHATRNESNVTEVEEMVLSWHACEVEDFRLVGSALLEKTEKGDGLRLLKSLFPQ